MQRKYKMDDLKVLKLKTNNHISEIYISNGVLECIGEHVSNKFKDAKVLIVTDENVDLLYGDKVLKILTCENINAYKLVLPPGEMTKSFEGLLRVYDALGINDMSRTDVILALGGGVIGDLTGFAAATWQRGMGLVQVPTSLLAQIDSSIGGKTAIDVKWGKNMIGAFKQPDLVFIDPGVLNSLDKKEFSAGMAEMIKYACIWDKLMFDTLKTKRENIKEYLPELILKACEIKKRIVEKDSLDLGLRMILNFGHTMAHVIESVTGYNTLSHGFAVAIGMVYITKRSEMCGITRPGTAKEIEDVCKMYGLPTQIPVIDKQVAREYIYRDKKARSRKMNLILIEEIGSYYIYKPDIDEAVRFLDLG